MTPLHNISDFFSRIDCPFQIYEMGRLVKPVSADTFLEFEQNESPWPFPFLRQAWFAILFWVPERERQNAAEAKPERHHVWFLKFPLDEQAKLNLAARDDFLRQLFSALEHYLGSTETDPVKKFQSLEASIKDNPYGFKPNQERMANFHAGAHQHLMLPASKFYLPAVDYLTGIKGFEQWNFVAYQGLADTAARLDETFNAQSVARLVGQSILKLPDEPLIALLNCLENHPLPQPLSELIMQCLDRELGQATDTTASQQKHSSMGNPVLIASLIRSLASTPLHDVKQKLLQKILMSVYSSHIEILAAISTKCWPDLKVPDLLTLFLEALAGNTQGQASFNAVITDLIFIPGMREVILQQLRSTQRSPLLTQAIGAFFKQTE